MHTGAGNRSSYGAIEIAAPQLKAAALFSSLL
jgi:hypothetical protein